jgi:hypothetical protein
MGITSHNLVQPTNESFTIENKSGVPCVQVNIATLADGTGNFTAQIYNPGAFYADDGNSGFTDINQLFNDFKKNVKETRKAWLAEQPEILPEEIPSESYSDSSSDAVADSETPSESEKTNNGKNKTSTV